MLTSNRLIKASDRLILLNPVFSWWTVLHSFLCIKEKAVGDRTQQILNETFCKKNRKSDFLPACPEYFVLLCFLFLLEKLFTKLYT